MKVIHRTREEVIKLWVKALRSGEYKQTKDSLKNRGGFCCLGVLCDLAAKDGGGDWYRNEYRGYKSSPPYNIQKFIFNKFGSKFMSQLMCYNDNGKSFEFIADKIEKKYLK